MDKTSPAVYDKTLTLAKVLGELIELKREEAAEAAPVSEAGAGVPDMVTVKPEGAPDGQS